MDDNIHAPTVASGPTSGGPARDVSKLSMPDLMQEKERIEAELSALSSVLDTVSLPNVPLTPRKLLLLIRKLDIAWRDYELYIDYLRWIPS